MKITLKKKNKPSKAGIYLRLEGTVNLNVVEIVQTFSGLRLISPERDLRAISTVNDCQWSDALEIEMEK
jgi:hypothetical protein